MFLRKQCAEQGNILAWLLVLARAIPCSFPRSVIQLMPISLSWLDVAIISRKPSRVWMRHASCGSYSLFSILNLPVKQYYGCLFISLFCLPVCRIYDDLYYILTAWVSGCGSVVLWEFWSLRWLRAFGYSKASPRISGSAFYWSLTSRFLLKQTAFERAGLGRCGAQI